MEKKCFLKRGDYRHAKNVLIIPELILFVLIKVDLDATINFLDEEFADVSNDLRSSRRRIRDDVEVGELSLESHQLKHKEIERERVPHDMGYGSFDRFVDDSNFLVEVRWIASSLESDDSTSKRVNNVLE